MNDTVTPLVSVVIPTYNHAHFLGRALQSVLNQTYLNWEAIVIDNHSTDNTDEVMASFSDQRITYLKIKNNGVIAVSRNAGIRVAKGEWIAFLDSDDWWSLDKLKVCIDCINNKVDLICHDLVIVSDKTRYFRRKVIKPLQLKNPVLIDLMVRWNQIATSSVVVRKQILVRLNGMNESPDMVGAEDYNTWLRIAQLTNGFRSVSKPLGFYQKHEKGISQKDMSEPIQHALADYIHLLSPQQKNRLCGNIKYIKGRFEYLNGNILIANQNLLFSIKYTRLPLKIKSAMMIVSGFVKR